MIHLNVRLTVFALSLASFIAPSAQAQNSCISEQRVDRCYALSSADAASAPAEVARRICLDTLKIQMGLRQDSLTITGRIDGVKRTDTVKLNAWTRNFWVTWVDERVKEPGTCSAEKGAKIRLVLNEDTTVQKLETDYLDTYDICHPGSFDRRVTYTYQAE